MFIFPVTKIAVYNGIRKRMKKKQKTKNERTLIEIRLFSGIFIANTFFNTFSLL